MKKIYIGVDIGTTSIKLSAVDNQLNKLYDVQFMYDYLTPHKDWTEIEPDTWLEIVLEGLNKTFQYVSSDQVAGIGITGQMHTTVFVDEHGYSVRPAIMWNDSRTKTMIPEIKNILLQSEETAHISKIVSTGSPLANLLWVSQQEPKNYSKIRKILIAKDYLVLKLTGNYSTDFCDASTSSMYDLNSSMWSMKIQEKFEFPKEIFPDINYSSKIVGYLTKEMQNKLKIKQTIPVVAGTGDNVASAVVSGCFANNQPLISLGTSGVVVIPNQNHQLKEIGKNVVAKIQENDDTIITQGTVQAGAKVNSWWMNSILHTDDFVQEQKKIPDELLGKNELLFFPYLNGEKTIYGKPNLRGAFVGLSLNTTREEMYLAVLEGLTFGIRRLFDLLRNHEQPEYFLIVGGGAKSALWVQLFANILQTPIKRVQSSQEAVDGAALLAIIGVEGSFEFRDTTYQIIQPQEQLIQEYEKQYNSYLRLSELIIEFTEE